MAGRNTNPWARFSVLILLILVSATNAYAQAPEATSDPVEEARAHMERGQALYIQTRYIEAAEEFQSAFEKTSFSAFLFNIGVCYDRLGDTERALRFYRQYLSAEPNADDRQDVMARINRLEPSATAIGATPPTGTPATNPDGTPATNPDGTPTTNPDGTPVTNPDGTPVTNPDGTGTAPVDPAPAPVALGEVAAEDIKSFIAVDVDPPGGDVFVKRGQEVLRQCTAPCQFSLPQGTYVIEMASPEFATMRQELPVEPGNGYRVYASLRQGTFFGHLALESNPPGAAISIDGNNEGQTTTHRTVLPIGEHTIRLEKPGFEPQERTITVGGTAQTAWVAELVRVGHGRLSVVANERGAEVEVDGVLVGVVPFMGDVPPGLHTVTVSASGMKDFETEVTVQAGQITPVHVTLRESVPRGAAWTTLIFGALLVGGGFVLADIGTSQLNELKAQQERGVLTDGDERFLQGQLFVSAADAAWLIGGVLLGLSVYYFLRDPLPDSEGAVLQPRDWAFVPYVTPDGAGAGAVVRF